MPTRFDNSGNPDIKEVVARYRGAMKRRLRWIAPLALLAIAVVVALTGVYTVGPGEVGVVRTFGKNTDLTRAGLHFAFPFFQRVDVINVEKVRQIEIGYRSEGTSDKRGGDSTSAKRVPSEAQMVTGDENIVEAQLVVQYVIAEPDKVLFKLRDFEKVLSAATEVALRSVVGRTTIDDILTQGREQAQIETKIELQELLDKYDSGLAIREVKLQEVDAPEEVKDAFHDVVRAREEKEKVINEAKSYEADIIPRARGEAQKRLRAAEAYREQRKIRARGDVSKFLSVLAEYSKAKAVTRERLHIETVQRIMSSLGRKVFVDGAMAKGSVPIMNLNALMGAAGVGAGPTAGPGK
ncbi:MAG: FtsH protease activity modulator HflK [Polyangiaceae bacterium]|nr:FtsH protease activity modulator HflK [Polyangiaceae bacterium]